MKTLAMMFVLLLTAQFACPQVEDHRTGRKTVEVERVLEGELDLVKA